MYHLAYSEAKRLNLCYLMMENMKAIEKTGRTKALPYGMVFTELFRFLRVELSQEIYTNVSDKGVINENFVSRTLTGKELKKEESLVKRKDKKMMFGKEKGSKTSEEGN